MVMLPLLLLAAAARWAWDRVRSRRAARDFTDAEADQIVRDAVAGYRLDEQPIDIVDRPWSRSAREIHGMTVPQFQDVDAEFVALIEANWPNQT